MITIISWNVNGLRAVHKKGNFEAVLEQKPDILCLQETKSLPDQLPPQSYEKYRATTPISTSLLDN